MDASLNLVSVTIPFRNSAAFLAEAIESVLAQTYQKWELFLVDDGSSDGSREIAEMYAQRIPGKIRCVEHPYRQNLGVTRSRNLGASLSSGEFLAFLDSDDVWLPSKLDFQIALMRDHPEAALVYGPSEYWYDWEPSGSEIQTNQVPPVAPGERLYSPPTLFTASYPFGVYGAPCPSSLLVRRKAFERVGKWVEEFRPETYQLYEDTAFLSKLYLGFPVFVTARCLDRYRCHRTSIWHRTMGTISEEKERRFYFQWLRNYLQSNSITDRRVWSAVRRAGWMYRIPLPIWAARFLRRAARRLRRPAMAESQRSDLPGGGSPVKSPE